MINTAFRFLDSGDLILDCQFLYKFYFFRDCTHAFSLFSVVNADLVLSNKLVVYDLETQVIGWTEYNCEYIFFSFLFQLFCTSIFP